MLPLFSTLQRNFHLQKSFHKPIFDTLDRLDIGIKGSQNQSIAVWWRTLKKGTLQKKGKAFLNFLKITY